MKKQLTIWGLLLTVVISSCNNTKDQDADQHSHVSDKESKPLYTCPMPQDSVFSDKPGKCPKCGMELELVTNKSSTAGLEPESILQPANEFVVSSIPVTTMQPRAEQIEIETLGYISYDNRNAGSIAARVSGRIEKLYVRYRFQKVNKGQRIMDVYSPEILTAQQNLLFLLKNDPDNVSLVQAASDKLRLLGMSDRQLQDLIKNRTPAFTIAVYSNYSGHIHESSNSGAMDNKEGNMKDISLLTEELNIKEGMYVQKGQSVFKVYNPDKAWALLNIYADHQALVKKGNTVRVVPETAPGKDFRATIDFIEPFFRVENKTLTARVNFDNSLLKIPVGSQVKATIFGNTKKAFWLPRQAVLSLGLDAVVFRKYDNGFKAQKISTGMLHDNNIQVLDGLSEKDSVAINAQYLMDSESFIKIKN
ncbi:efflux RND transporter periplasmic adaptor subunit [Flavihumibacter stibioxidans]|uniref:Copper transporter n=1 Tax=Flavihumibacter stibioxidans TaxID=1834163 RepID=A0ABR7MAI3_9BACT|nr:efflux RND transporter periplasmic adaptor subunit [Flavihumibacter stibioxidans]MBC6491573.1 copper transporter [Flavihumibacter stibioxidans]